MFLDGKSPLAWPGSIFSAETVLKISRNILAKNIKKSPEKSFPRAAQKAPKSKRRSPASEEARPAKTAATYNHRGSLFQS